MARIALLSWQPHDGVAGMMAEAMEQMGHRPVRFLPEAPLPEAVEAVVAYGPWGSLVPLGRQLLSVPAERRPPLAFWLLEQLWNPALPAWAACAIGEARAALERWAYAPNAAGLWRPRRGFKALISKAFRFRYYGDLAWLRRTGLLKTLGIPSVIMAGFLRRRGFQVVEAFFGAHSAWGADLALDRDVPVLWLGKPGSRRRRRVLDRIRADLLRRGIPMMMVDGVEHPHIFGHERTVLLNRTQIVLNVLREPWDSNTMRWGLAAVNRALVVTEPTQPHTPLAPGVHLVVRPVDEIGSAIEHYLAHESERAQIVGQAHAFAMEDMHVGRSVRRLVTRLLERAA